MRPALNPGPAFQAAKADPAARIAGLRFEYPGVRALDDVSFTLAGATVTALVGPNGAGKSTLLRCMAGLETPVQGAIEVAGVDVLDAPRKAHRRLGYLSDFFGVYDALTVRQCLTHAGAIHGTPDSELAAAVTRTAGRLGLDDRLEVAAGTLSRGLRQRLAIGQAIIHSPQLLLLDEPAAGLDPEARHGLAMLFRELQANGMTIVVSSHILAELDEYSTDMLVLKDGRIVEQRELRPGGEAREYRMQLTLSAPDARALEVLASQPDVASVVAEGAEVRFALRGGQDRQAQILRALVEAGVAVVAFGESRENLHDSYLRTVSEARK
jgi:ABC-2 type transport system ATP-binding protein